MLKRNSKTKKLFSSELGETIKLEKYKKTESTEKFSLQMSDNTWLTSTFSDIHKPCVFKRELTPNRSKYEFDSLDEGLNTMKLSDVLSTNSVKEIVKSSVVIPDTSFGGMYHTYTLNLKSKENIAMSEIVSLVQKAFEIERQLYEQEISLRVQKSKINFWRYFFRIDSEKRKVLKKCIQDRMTKRIILTTCLNTINLDISKPMKKGDLLPLYEIIYPNRKYTKSVLIMTKKPLRIEKH